VRPAAQGGLWFDGRSCSASNERLNGAAEQGNLGTRRERLEETDHALNPAADESNHQQYSE
jgi:hypothetical protein